MVVYRFGPFELDPQERRLSRQGVTLDCQGRYLDALQLLVSEPGRLITKDRFFDQVWRGVPVTDEALTQCIRSLRRLLDDDAQKPRFIETVPRHGYRFVAEVANGAAAAPMEKQGRSGPGLGWMAVAGTVGAGLAGLVGGLFYGFAVASQPLPPGTGALSVVLVLTCATILVALLGGAGVSLGLAGARRLAGAHALALIVGGAAGGLVVGAVTRLLGLDAFALLLGRSPGAITGGLEGMVLGAFVGLGASFAEQLRAHAGPALRIASSAIAGALGGVVVTLMGGRMLGGSLDELARAMPGARLRVDGLGLLLGEDGFGWWTRLVTSALEGALFASGIVLAMALARRQYRQ